MSVCKNDDLHMFDHIVENAECCCFTAQLITITDWCFLQGLSGAHSILLNPVNCTLIVAQLTCLGCLKLIAQINVIYFFCMRSVAVQEFSAMGKILSGVAEGIVQHKW